MSYIIGGHTYSLNDIENGVLRANKRGALQFSAPFGKSDPRLKTSHIQVIKFSYCYYYYYYYHYYYCYCYYYLIIIIIII